MVNLLVVDLDAEILVDLLRHLIVNLMVDLMCWNRVGSTYGGEAGSGCIYRSLWKIAIQVPIVPLFVVAASES